MVCAGAGDDQEGRVRGGQLLPPQPRAERGGEPLSREQREVVIWRGQDSRGLRVITASRPDGGGIAISGQDLGPAVQAFGPEMREYEWDWRIEAVDVPRAVALLGGSADDDPIDLLRRWAQANPSRDPGQFLKEGGLTMRFWSRVGE